MAVIIPPAQLPLSQVSWRLKPAAQINQSSWTGASKVVGLPGADTWTLSATFASITTAVRALLWRNFFMKLHGPINSFPIIAVAAQQTEAANPLVGAGAGYGNTLPLTSLPANATVLLGGMMMTVPLPSGHQRLVGLEDDLVSDASGHATATFWPELGQAPVAGAAVEIQWPFGLMRMTADAFGWDMSERIKTGFTLNTVEAL